MDDIYENTEEYNPKKKRKILIVFDDMIMWLISSETINVLRFLFGLYSSIFL